MEPHNHAPTDHGKLSPKFFFLSLGVLVSLIISITAFLALAFEVLDFKFPDALNATYQYGYNSYNFSDARMFMAMLIIFLPIFYVLMRWYKRAIKAGLSHVDEVVRKWTAYLIIFLAVLVAAIDLVVLINYFVGGEITTRFIIKVLVTLAVAKWAGYYFYAEIRETRWKKIIRNVYPWSAAILALALVIWSFFVIGTPGEQRAWRLDERRVQDLQSIQYQVINYWQQKEQLPAELKDLAEPTSYFNLPVDPEFQKGNTYEYRIIDAEDLKFELCATFSADMPHGWVENSYGGVRPFYGRDIAVSEPAMFPYPGGTNQSWDHEAGRTCFERTIDPEIYPPFEDPVPLKR